MATAIAPKRKPLTLATDLIALAEDHGWTVREQWTPPGYKGPPILRVVIGRRVSDREAFLYRLEFRTDGTKAAQAQWRARTPKNPKWHKAPTVASIRKMIAANAGRKAES